LSLVEKLLSLRLVSFELGNLGGQTISFQLQWSIFGRELVYLGLQRCLVGSSLSSNSCLPNGQPSK
jgi:hypothetical protein